MYRELRAEEQVSQNQLETFATEEIANGLWADFVVDGRWDGGYTVRSCVYNDEIPVGEAVTIGFRISDKGDGMILPSQFKLEENAKGMEPEFLYDTTAQIDYAILHIGYQENDCQYAVTEDVVLETKGELGSDIVWSSSNGAVIDESSHVSRPEKSIYVTLTASIDDGTEKVEKQFVVKVIRQELQEDDSFEPYIRDTDEIHSTYRFKQYYKGIEVLDHGQVAENEEQYVLAWRSFIDMGGETLDVLMDAKTSVILRETSCSTEE